MRSCCAEEITIVYVTNAVKVLILFLTSKICFQKKPLLSKLKALMKRNLTQAFYDGISKMIENEEGLSLYNFFPFLYSRDIQVCFVSKMPLL